MRWIAFRLGVSACSLGFALIRLVAHYTTVHQVGYLTGQPYLDPHPKELMLRNLV